MSEPSAVYTVTEFSPPQPAARLAHLERIERIAHRALVAYQRNDKTALERALADLYREMPKEEQL